MCSLLADKLMWSLQSRIDALEEAYDSAATISHSRTQENPYRSPSFTASYSTDDSEDDSHGGAVRK